MGGQNGLPNWGDDPSWAPDLSGLLNSLKPHAPTADAALLDAALLIEPRRLLPLAAVRWIFSAAALAAALGVINLIGWGSDVGLLKSLVPGQVAMQPWTAAALLLTALALMLVAGKPATRRTSRILAITLAALAGQTLLEYVADLDLGTDLLLFGDAVLTGQTRAYPNPGRMGVLTAVNFGLIAGALLVEPYARRRRLTGNAFAALGIGALAIAASALFGYLMVSIGEPPFLLYPTAMPTALGMLALAGATLALRPELSWVRFFAGLGARGWIIAGVLSVAGVMGIFGLDRLVMERTAAPRTAQLQLGLASVLATLTDAESGQRGYLLTGDASYLEPYEAARLRLPYDLGSVIATFGQAPPLARLLELSGEKMSELAKTVSLRRNGDASTALALVKTNRGKATMDLIRAVTEQLSRDAALAAERSACRVSLDLTFACLSTGVLLSMTLLGLAVLRRSNLVRRAGDDRFHAMVDAIPAMTWESNASGAVTWLSGAWRRYCGTDADTLLGAGWFTIMHPAELAEKHAQWQEALRAGEGYTHCMRIRRACDGVWRWHLAHGTPTRGAEGNIVRWVGSVTDIDDLIEAQSSAVQSEQRLRTVADTARIGLVVMDAEHCFRFTNKAYLQMLDIEQADIVGLPIAEVLPELYDRQIRSRLERAFRGQRIEVEFQMPQAAGRAQKHFNVIYEPARTPTNEVVVVVVVVDVSERVNASHALAEQEARIARLAKMEALGRLAGGIAHDFNNVLQTIQAGSALAAARLDERPEDARCRLRQIAAAAERGATVTRRLLAFARQDELRAEPIMAEPLFAGLLELLRPSLGPNIVVRALAPDHLPPLLADQGQLEAVLVNLANNARDAMPAGGAVTLIAEAVAHPGAPDAPADLVPGSYIRCSVIDQGEGMAPELVARVTEPFFTTKPKGKGTGLGLSMARGFAEQSGGSLTITSTPGRGTSVSLWLPQVQAVPLLPPRDAAPASVDAEIEPGNATVLLVDDEPEMRTMIAEHLELAGYLVWETDDAAGALRLLESGLRPDVLVTDLVMPGKLDGLGLVRESRTRLPRLPAILMTGQMDMAEDGLTDAEADGPFALLYKPARPDVLSDRLACVLGQRGERTPAVVRELAGVANAA